MPEPMFTPMRSAFAASITSAASSSAILVAARPKWMNVSERRVSFSGIQSEAVKPFTSAAMRVGSTEASKRVIGPTPLRPLSRLSQALAIPRPTGDTTPRPVTTTLRLVIRSLSETGGDAGGAGRPQEAAPRGRRAPSRHYCLMWPLT